MEDAINLALDVLTETGSGKENIPEGAVTASRNPCKKVLMH